MPARPTTSRGGKAATAARLAHSARLILAWGARWREPLVAGALFLVAGGLRLWLAAHGWPYLNSDEAVMGLMGVDIAHGRALPVFTYSQNYIGALQAYIAAPFFALLHGDPLALRLATWLQTMLFLAVMYPLARRLFSPVVAALTLALLSVGPEYLLKHQLQAGVGAQDTLLFGALTVWLATLRLRGGWGPRGRLALDVALGLAIGLGLWGDFLFLPYVFAAAAALLYAAARSLAAARRSGGARPAARRLGIELVTLLGAAILGALPLIAANLASGGATLRHVTAIAGTPGARSESLSLAARSTQLVWQIGATLLVSLPAALGSEPFCRGCAIWPAQGSVVTFTQASRAVLINLPFTLVVVGLWLAASLPLARSAWRAIARATSGAAPRGWAGRLFEQSAPTARAWGRFMLAAGGALTVLQYMVSQASFVRPTYTNRYLVGIYIATPLIAAPLEPSLRAAWRAARRRVIPHWRALAASALLAILLSVSVFGAARSVVVAWDAASYGDPLNSRDAPLVAFLEEHHATAFYTGYWTCGRLILATSERLNCSVLSMDSAFAPGFNRYPPAERAVARARHPAWVFDMRELDVGASVPEQMAACVRASAPPCAGYTSATVNGYRIYYYAG
ncbi:MAG TPA: glycosyltransferase family 39 protein [Ktedonobacterales bacterium]